MAYGVLITPAAQRDADEFVGYLRGKLESEVTVARWVDGLFTAIDTLAEMPSRCPLVRERRLAAVSVRGLLYASHRIVFRHHDTTVTVLRIYQASRRALS